MGKKKKKDIGQKTTIGSLDPGDKCLVEMKKNQYEMFILYDYWSLTFAVLSAQFSFNRACYAKMDFYMISINVSLTYKIINFDPKGPILPLRINNTQEKVRKRTWREEDEKESRFVNLANGEVQYLENERICIRLPKSAL